MEKLKTIFKNHKKKLIFALILLISIAWYQIYYPTITWQQKLTVEINTPNGVKNGYGIYEVKNTFYGSIFNNSPNTLYHGYAAIVELDDGKYLFILQGNPRFRVENAFRNKSVLDPVEDDVIEGKNIRLRSFYREIVKYKPSRPVNMNDRNNESSIYGIYFRDMKYASSAVKVDLKNMEEVFGEGYSLKSVQLSIVEDALDFSQIEKILPWVTEEKYNFNTNLAGEVGYRSEGPAAYQNQFRHLYQLNSDL